MGPKIIDLGLVDFEEGLSRQKELFRQVKEGFVRSGLIFCRHNPVITIGRSGSRKNILASKQELKDRGILVYEAERGGDVTYHGPGQLTIYPVLDLNYFKKDIHWFLRYLENLIISSLAASGVKGETRPGLTGVWVKDLKIASVGIAVKNWITFYGLSINVKKADLSSFSLIRPCGMDIMITSVETETGRDVSVDELKESFVAAFKGGRG